MSDLEGKFSHYFAPRRGGEGRAELGAVVGGFGARMLVLVVLVLSPTSGPGQREVLSLTLLLFPLSHPSVPNGRSGCRRRALWGPGEREP